MKISFSNRNYIPVVKVESDSTVINVSSSEVDWNELVSVAESIASNEGTDSVEFVKYAIDQWRLNESEREEIMEYLKR